MMTDATIVIAKRRKDQTLHIVCPYCERHHSHGSGGKNRLHYYRGSHCADRDLPERLFAKRHELSYFIVVLDELMMTETDMRKLFADMDAIADDPMHDLLDCQISFRRLQKERFPNLTREQFLGLFELWGTQYAARLKAKREGAVRSVTAFAQAAARIVPRGAPFKCVCGEEGDPSDPAFERIHQPHCYVAGLDKVTDPKSMVRWKMVR